MKNLRLAVACGITVALVPPTLAIAQDQALTADLRTGSCNASREVVSSLSDPTVPQGEPVGAGSGVTAATSYSEAELSYEVLLATEHVLTISDGDDVVACGPVGGVQGSDGSLVPLLTERDGSGVSGVAFLAPAADPALTAISLFLNPGDSAAGSVATDADVSSADAIAESPQAPEEVLSQGLGLTETQFGERYGTTQEEITIGAYVVENGSIVAYRSFGDPVRTVERVFDAGISYEEAVAQSETFMPSDTVFVQQYVSDSDQIVDVYSSEWLRGQFPNPDEWINAEPGVFIVTYGSYNPALGDAEVTRLVLATGNNP